jgi:diguanylate cyclase (GGDEF)-like protein
MGRGTLAGIAVYDVDLADTQFAVRGDPQDAQVDRLTGLENRHRFETTLADCFSRDMLAKKTCHILLLDLDDFKEVNYRFGLLAGDHVIATVAKRLQNLKNEGVLVGRLAGNEFAILLNRQMTLQMLQEMADKVVALIEAPIRFLDNVIHMTVSVGVATYPNDANSADGLLGCATMALLDAKKHNFAKTCFYDSGIATKVSKHRAALDKVRNAAATRSIIPYYQPKFRLGDLSVYGFEALARIKNADGTVTGPSDFWPAFEDHTTSSLIATNMVDAVINDIQRWLDSGFDPGVVSINACEYSFQDADFVSRLIRKIDFAGIPRSKIEIEVTENVLCGSNRKLVGRLLSQLRTEGLLISLDDFGTGFASLTHLRDYPIDTLKIDRSFVNGIGNLPKSMAIVEALVGLGHKLGMELVAEGIETQSQMDFLLSINCDRGQGYLVSRPVAAQFVPTLV